uniref:Uncharacterized protein n=1 Tax=Rhizophora mucronata TaxID=61149 RepID=A0A2P2QDU9_RHIMU
MCSQPYKGMNVMILMGGHISSLELT